MEKTVSEAIAYRRSVRIFKETPLPDGTVADCLRNAVLAPTSSNLQLWEFHHITEKSTLKKPLQVACLNQNAAKTARELVVVVSRRDLFKKRAKANTEFLHGEFGNKDIGGYSRREKFAINYYTKLIPFIYTDFLGILGWIKYIITWISGLFRPIYREVRTSDLRIVAHKSAALAAENFMISMAALGYDTCPMEGFDSYRVKRLLKLPKGAEICMVIGCGIRDDKGIYGKRFRVPFTEVYHEYGS